MKDLSWPVKYLKLDYSDFRKKFKIEFYFLDDENKQQQHGEIRGGRSGNGRKQFFGKIFGKTLCKIFGKTFGKTVKLIFKII